MSSEPSPDRDQDVLDEDTFRAFQANDDLAIERVVRHVERRLLPMLRLWLRRHELAEEMAQETLLLLYQNRKQIHRVASLMPWVFITARRLAMREASRKGNSLEFVADAEQLGRFIDQASRNSRDALQAETLGRRVAEVISRLPSHEQELLSLRFFSDLKLAEIAEVLGMPLGSVGTRLQRTLEKLRRQLEDSGITPEEL